MQQRWEKTRKIKSYVRAISRDSLTNQDAKTLEWIDWIKGYIVRRESNQLRLSSWD
jgi:hypothetical protein